MVRLTIRYLLLLALRSYLPHHGSFLTSSLSFKIKELAPPGEYVSEKRPCREPGEQQAGYLYEGYSVWQNYRTQNAQTLASEDKLPRT
jgi:hypothetical protein